MKFHLGTLCLVGLIVAGLMVAPRLLAQDEAATKDAAALITEDKPYDSAPEQKKPLTLEERRAEEARKKALRLDDELRSRLSETIWNDLDLRAGDPGQLWMLRRPKIVNKKEDRAWFLNDEKGLPRVGSWEVKGGELILKAMNGTLIGRGKFNPDDEQIVGRFIDADHHREFGQFRLKEETKRNYRVLSMDRSKTLRRR